MDLYSIGEMLIDFIPGKEPGSYIRMAGGAPANVAVAVSKNGLEAGMNCSVGDDDFGRFLMDTLKSYGVRPITRRLCKKAVTTMAFVTLTPEGERSFTFARKPGADMFLYEDDVREEDIAQSAIVHAGSCSLSAEPAASATKKALRLGRALGKLVSFDVNYRDNMWNGDADACKSAVLECLPYADLLKVSDEEAGMFFKDGRQESFMENYGISLLVQTLGSEGARACFKGHTISVSGRKARCVDATGAGDAFWGGFLSSLLIQGVKGTPDLTDEKIRAALDYGNIAGWLCVQTKGAQNSLPTRAEVEKHL